MKLAFCTFKYFPYGGLQRDFLRIAIECRRRGHAVRVYALSWEGEIPEGFDVRFVPVKAWRNHRRVRKYADWVRADLARDPVDATIGFNKMPSLDVYYAADACFKEKALTQRGPLYRLGARYRFYVGFEEAVFGRDSRTTLLMISEPQARFFEKHYGTQRDRMIFLPPNVARDRIAPADAPERRAAFRRKNGFGADDRLVVQIGSGFIKKGVDRSIRAVASLPEPLRSRTTLWVVGKDRFARFEALAKRLGVAKRIRFVGGRDDVPEMLLGADLMLHPAYDENTGTVLLEAVAAGLPVLCTAICGYGSHVEAAGCGAVVPEPFEQSALNRELERLLCADRRSLSEKALEYARTRDLYGMHLKAVDAIDALGERRKR